MAAAGTQLLIGLTGGAAVVGIVWVISRQLGRGIDEAFGDWPSIHPEMIGKVAAAREISGRGGCHTGSDQTQHVSGPHTDRPEPR